MEFDEIAVCIPCDDFLLSGQLILTTMHLGSARLTGLSEDAMTGTTNFAMRVLVNNESTEWLIDGCHHSHRKCTSILGTLGVCKVAWLDIIAQSICMYLFYFHGTTH